MKSGPLLQIGRYEIREKIAAGGMATVYKAIQTGVGGFQSQVAVKILHGHLAQDREFRKMFLEEAKIGALLQHRCLLNVLDYGEEEGISYIVTEYFASSSLEDFVRTRGAFDLAEALHVLAETAEGLSALHEARDLDGRRLGLVHRDVSPQNVLLGTDGTVKLIDYGIVKREDPTEKTRPGIVKGKCRYMAPEQAAGKTVDPRADIYALGLVFVRLLTGRKPHGAGDTGQIMARARQGVDLARLRKGLSLPSGVSDLIERTLAVRPSDRYGRASELAVSARAALLALKPAYDMHAFGRFVSEKPLARRAASRRPHSRKPSGRPGPDAARAAVEDETINPRAVFGMLAVLFGIALVAFLFDRLF